MCDPTIYDFLNGPYRRLRLLGASPATLATYHATVGRLDRWRRRRCRLSELSDETVSEFLAHLAAEGLSHATVNRHRRTILAIWRLARRRRRRGDDLPDLPEPDVDGAKESKREPRAWTADEFRRLLAAAAASPGKVGEVLAAIWWPALILTAYNTGLRISAVMALRAADCDLDAGRLLARAETQKQRADQAFGLFPSTIRLLRGLRRGSDGGLFDDWPYDRTQHSWPALNNGLRRILRAAGLPTGRRDLWHKLRRTVATDIRRQAGMAAAQSLLGHSTPRVTARYIDRAQLAEPTVPDLLADPAEDLAVHPAARQLRLFDPGRPKSQAG